jgi:hypothetical protein
MAIVLELTNVVGLIYHSPFLFLDHSIGFEAFNSFCIGIALVDGDFIRHIVQGNDTLRKPLCGCLSGFAVRK